MVYAVNESMILVTVWAYSVLFGGIVGEDSSDVYEGSDL